MSLISAMSKRVDRVWISNSHTMIRKAEELLAWGLDRVKPCPCQERDPLFSGFVKCRPLKDRYDCDVFGIEHSLAHGSQTIVKLSVDPDPNMSQQTIWNLKWLR